MHVILRAVHCANVGDEESARPTDNELKELARLGPEKSFDTLPLYMQEALRKLKGKI